MEEGSIEHLHGFQLEAVEEGAHAIPEVSLAAQFLQHRLEQAAAQLLSLVHQECEHHKLDEVHTQVFFAETVVMLEIVSLVLEGVKGLVLDFPSGATSSHDPVDVLLAQGDVRDPGESFRLLTDDLIEFEEIHQNVLMRGVNGQTVSPTKIVEPPRFFRIVKDELSRHASAHCLVKASEKVSVVGLLDVEDETAIHFREKPDVRSVGADGILGYNNLDMGMLIAELLDKSFAGIDFTVVFVTTVLPGDDLGDQGNHFCPFGMNDSGAKHLKVVSDFARRALFYHAGVGEKLM